MSDRDAAVPAALAEALADRYVVRRELGRGGMATVFLADDRKHGRQVAIKVMRPDLAAVMGEERFRREIEIAARLTHPHIVPLHDSGVVAGYPYYVMPYIDGESLRARLERERSLALDEALRLTREVAAALAYAHSRGLVHRDVKPENILLSDGIALVADFGIARPIAAAVAPGAETTAAGGPTQMGAAVGTPRYMAPEQAVGGPVDGRSDQYALACVLYEMLAGRPPFATGTTAALLRQHLAEPPAPLSDHRPEVPAGVVAAVATALAKLPEERFATVAQFVDALAGAAAPAASSATTPRPAIPNNLPKERTHFIGRDAVLAECARLLAGTRLLTVTGIGGCGKTRLALKLAERLLPEYPDGAWFVDLAPLQDAEHVALAVATALGVGEVAGATILDTLTRHLAARRSLLVLDNCEHVLSGAAETADALLAGTREVKLLVTSREGLAVPGEQLLALPSMTVPPAGAGGAAAIEACEAVRLFVDRARLADPSFSLGAANAAATAEICRRLDGIPLAIELAAARVKVLAVDEIRARLDDRFRLLAGGSRKALPRHQTLRAAVDWSYELLTDEEKRLLRSLAVFSGGWTLEAATRVAGGDDELATLEELTHLVDKSLVRVDREGGRGSRFAMLETVRQYALEKLAGSGEADGARRRHLAELAALAERAYEGRLAAGERWSGALAAEHDNLRAALDVAREQPDVAYLELCGALGWFWQIRSHYHEGRERLDEALAGAPADASKRALARAIWAQANLMAWSDDSAGALPRMEEALRLWREVGDGGEVALALEGLGWALMLSARDEEACTTLRECLALQHERGDPVLINRATVALAQALVALAEVDEARALAGEVIVFSQARGDRRDEHFGWHFVADCALIEGKCEEGLAAYRRSLALVMSLGDHVETGFEVQGVAMSLAGLDEPLQALRLAGAVHAEFERIGVDLHIRFWDALLDRYLSRARSALGAAAADRAWSEGRLIPFDEAASAALAAAGPRP